MQLRSNSMRLCVLVLALVGYALGMCPGQNLLPNPRNPEEKGPYAVGVVETVLTERNLTTAIWYPAVPGSDAGQEPFVWDIREYMPPRHEGKIPDNENPWNVCERFDITCHYNLPLDTAHGPYPVMVFIHGTAGFRTQSLTHMIHWASRGFVVVAADHPGINLADLLALPPVGGTDQAGDARKLFKAVEDMEEDGLQFLRGHVDLTRFAASGHSAGGGAVQNLGDVANVIIPMAGFGVNAGPRLESALILGGFEDGYANRRNGYLQSPAPKRLVGLEKSGHHFCSEMCFLGREDGGLVEIAVRNGIPEAELFRGLGEHGCDFTFSDDRYIQPEEQWPIVNYASSAVMEATLMCDDDMVEALRQLESTLPHVGEYEEELSFSVISM